LNSPIRTRQRYSKAQWSKVIFADLDVLDVMISARATIHDHKREGCFLPKITVDLIQGRIRAVKISGQNKTDAFRAEVGIR